MHQKYIKIISAQCLFQMHDLLQKKFALIECIYENQTRKHIKTFHFIRRYNYFAE